MSGGDWKQMFKAVQEGDEALVEFYLRSGIDPNYQHPEYMAAALVESIRFNHLNITKLLLENNADPTIKEVWAGDTPMSVATGKKNQEAIVLLSSYLKVAYSPTKEPEITLQQGLERFREKNAKYFSNKPKSAEAERFMQSHDIAHVVFGCDTSIYGEGVVKIWTTFGTDQSFWKVTKGYSDASAVSLASEYSFMHVAKNIGRFLFAIPFTIIRVKQMKKPWVWVGYEPYMDRQITEIREEFGIRVVE